MAESPWKNGHSIAVLREVSAGLQSNVRDYLAQQVDAGGVAAEWIIADGVAATAPVVLYFHGGAYLCGSPEQYRNATVWLSRVASVRVLVPDYRLAPEHPFPACFEDALAVYRWLLEVAQIASEQLIVAGDSAGASIAVTLAADARDQDLALPACIVANSAFADLALSSSSLDDPKLNLVEPKRVTIEWLAKTYLEAGHEAGQAVRCEDPRHSPIYRDLTGLPPLLVQTAGLDNLQDDGVRLAAQAQSCGVETMHTQYPTSGHIWTVAQPADTDPEAMRAVVEMSEFIHRHLPSQ